MNYLSGPCWSPLGDIGMDLLKPPILTNSIDWDYPDTTNKRNKARNSFIMEGHLQPQYHFRQGIHLEGFLDGTCYIG